MAGYGGRTLIVSPFSVLDSRVIQLNLNQAMTRPYQTQLGMIRKKLDSLKPVVEDIKVMKRKLQNCKITQYLSIKEVVNLEKVVSAGIELCGRVSKESHYVRTPLYRTALENLGKSLDRQFGIFHERRLSRVRIIGARQMLNNSHVEIRKLMGVKVSYGPVLKQINQKLRMLDVAVSNVVVIEEANRNLKLPIAIVQDFRKVLSDGKALLSEFSKERNGSRSRCFDDNLSHWNLSLMNQVIKLTPAKDRHRLHFV